LPGAPAIPAPKFWALGDRRNIRLGRLGARKNCAAADRASKHYGLALEGDRHQVAARLTPEALRNSSEGKQINEGHTLQIGGSIGDRVRMVA
jgi:hypothetical protein